MSAPELRTPRGDLPLEPNVAIVACRVLLLLVASFGSACSKDGAAIEPDAGDAMGDADAGLAPTFSKDIAPLLVRECLGCHERGGIAPLPLDDYEAVRGVAPLVVAEIESGAMPPWPPARSCLAFEHERGLSQEERALFSRWLEAGTPRGGDVGRLEPQATDIEFEATHVAKMRKPYLPDGDRSDDYRCFVMDLQFDDDVFVTGRQIVPGASSLVHHVLVYAADPSRAADVQAADDADPGPGYTCFGGPLPAPETAEDSASDTSAISMVNLGGWVPGQVPLVQPPGRATFIPKGSTVIMQVHYNLLDQEPVEDDTEVHFALTTEEPEYAVVGTPIAVLRLDIEAGDPHSQAYRVFYNHRTEPIRIVGVAPHMHLLGTSISVDKVAALGEPSSTECIVDIPEWDFSWQQSYSIAEEDTVVVEPGEGLVLMCTYDNSPEHQPIVSGEQQEPRDVTWGEGTLDEMCLAYIVEEFPWRGPPAIGCDAAAECMADCDDTEARCLLSCEGLDGGCRACVLRATAGCASVQCATEYFGAADCLRECLDGYVLLGGSFERCLQSLCPDAADAALACIGEVVADGDCDGQLDACGIEL